jgi:hypothetical protein
MSIQDKMNMRSKAPHKTDRKKSVGENTPAVSFKEGLVEEVSQLVKEIEATLKVHENSRTGKGK